MCVCVLLPECKPTRSESLICFLHCWLPSAWCKEDTQYVFVKGKEEEGGRRGDLFGISNCAGVRDEDLEWAMW